MLKPELQSHSFLVLIFWFSERLLKRPPKGFFFPASLFQHSSGSNFDFICPLILQTHTLKIQESSIQSSYGHHRTPCLGQTRGLLMHHLVNPGCRENSQQGIWRSLLLCELRQKEAYAASSSPQRQALLPGGDSMWAWRERRGLATFPQFD